MQAKQRIYCAGGFGINIGTQVPNFDNICYIDTSDSNRTDAIDPTKVYRIEGLNGAGQNLRNIYPKILPHIPTILERFEPAEFNIVIFSASGGSGRGLGPLIIRELLKAGKSVIALAVGETDTAIYLENTTNTLKSLESISLNLQRPIALAYYQNEKGVPLKVIDEEVLFCIEALLELTNQNNLELDNSDIHNWINYSNVVSLQPQLSALIITDDRKQANAVLEPIATLSLYSNRDDYAIVGNPHFSKVGYPREPLASPFEQLHFVINTIAIEEIMKALKERSTEQAQRFSNYRNRKSLVNIQDDTVTGEDMIL